MSDFWWNVFIFGSLVPAVAVQILSVIAVIDDPGVLMEATWGDIVRGVLLGFVPGLNYLIILVACILLYKPVTANLKTLTWEKVKAWLDSPVVIPDEKDVA